MTIADAEQEAYRARQSLSKMETEAALAREKGESMPAIFWESFGVAYASVKISEAAVCKAMESAR